MTIKERIILDLNEIGNPHALQQLLEFIELLKKKDIKPAGNKFEVASFSGAIGSSDAEEISLVIEKEFSKVEGEW